MIFKKNKNIFIPNSIGIIGAKSGVGVTHTAMLIANYLSSGLHYSVNYAELCKKSQLYDMVCNNPCYKGEDVCYEYKGIDYFPDATELIIRRLFMDKSSITIIDCGLHTQEAYSLMDKCELILAVGSVMPWCTERFNHLVQDFNTYYVDMHKVKFCIRKTDYLGKIGFLSNYHQALTIIPDGINPFAIRQNDFETIQNMMWLRKGGRLLNTIKDI